MTICDFSFYRLEVNRIPSGVSNSTNTAIVASIIKTNCPIINIILDLQTLKGSVSGVRECAGANVILLLVVLKDILRDLHLPKENTLFLLTPTLTLTQRATSDG